MKIAGFYFQGNVEVWLGNLLKEVQNTLHCVIRQAFYGIEDSAFKMLEFQVKRINFFSNSRPFERQSLFFTF